MGSTPALPSIGESLIVPGSRTKADLNAQVGGLVEKNIRHESRMADLLSKKLVLEKEVGDLKAQLAEAMGTCSGFEAQLKEASLGVAFDFKSLSFIGVTKV